MSKVQNIYMIAYLFSSHWWATFETRLPTTMLQLCLEIYNEVILIFGVIYDSLLCNEKKVELYDSKTIFCEYVIFLNVSTIYLASSSLKGTNETIFFNNFRSHTQMKFCLVK